MTTNLRTKQQDSRHWEGADLDRFRNVFAATRPVIGMVHFGALPGTPLYDADAGVEGPFSSALSDLRALQSAGFDAVLFGNENDGPYELNVDLASTATMACLIGRLREEISGPFGVNVLWDPMSTVAHAAATGAAFAREIFTGVHASDMGILTDNSYVQWVGEGAAVIDVGFPLRHSHSSLEVCDLRDLEGFVRLLAACLDTIGPDFSLSHDREPP